MRLLILVLLVLYAITAADDISSKVDAFYKAFRKHSILALGDSLTTGLFLTHHDLGHHPYTEELKRLINSTDIKILNHGVNGDTTARMSHRLQRVLDHHKNIKFAIILGGTNDLMHQQSADTTLKNLIMMHHTVHEMLGVTDTVTTIAFSIPHIKNGDEVARMKINKGLEDYAQKCSHLTLFHDLDRDLNKSIHASCLME